MTKELLTIQEAADDLGVSASTLKRLCETSAIPVIRTVGGHRRIDRGDLDEIAKVFWRSRTQRTQIAGADLPSISDIIQDLMANKPRQIAKAFTRTARNRLEIIEGLEDRLVASLWRLGEMWSSGEIDTYQEHLCSNAALAALDFIRDESVDLSNCVMTAVGGVLSPSNESIASKLVSVSLSLVKVLAIDIGANTPPQSLAKAAIDHKANFVWVTLTHIDDVETLVANQKILRSSLPQNIPIIIGGGGISPAIRRSLSWCQFYESVSQMITQMNLDKAR